MNKTTILAVALGVGALAGCNNTPQENAAENIEANADLQAENIVENAENAAENVEENAGTAADNAAGNTGY